MLIGFAKDIHKLKKQKNTKIKLANVSFDTDYKIIAHSDGDLVLHAISDAILSSIGVNDIGYYFSDKDINNKDLDSVQILNKSLQILKQNNYKIINIDLTVICNQIKIIDKRELLIKSLQNLIGIEKINIKGKRFEIKSKTIECYCAILIE